MYMYYDVFIDIILIAITPAFLSELQMLHIRPAQHRIRDVHHDGVEALGGLGGQPGQRPARVAQAHGAWGSTGFPWASPWFHHQTMVKTCEKNTAKNGEHMWIFM